MSNIIDQIKESIQQPEAFFSTYGFEDNRLKGIALRFLESATYGELEDNSYCFMREVLQIHGKDVFIRLSADAMKYIELYDPRARAAIKKFYKSCINFGN